MRSGRRQKGAPKAARAAHLPTWLAASAAFALLGAVFVAVGLEELRERHAYRAYVATIVENAMQSVELVRRMEADVYRRQFLVNAHIFEKEGVAMEQLEGDVAGIEADFDAAARAYEPLAIFPGERAAWDQLRRDYATSLGPVAEALSLSRVNRDEDARRILQGLGGLLAAIDADASLLIHINRLGAEHARAQILAAQRTVDRRTVAFQLIGWAALALAALWTARLIRERERATEGYTTLLEAQNRDLDAFAGRVAHDLRNPLGTITMATGMLAQRLPSEDRLVEMLRRASASMAELIEDLLTLSRLSVDHGRGACDPAAVVERIRDELRERLAAESATLCVAVEPTLVQFGAGMLRQVLVNLTDNALKYRRREAPAEITIRGHAVGPRYELRVTDNGIGMSADDASRAFDPFYRAVRVRDRPGTGLGLSIVQRVVEGHGGTVALDSKPGRGTSVLVSMPLSLPESSTESEKS
jgi:signal transduction histidine kinase